MNKSLLQSIDPDKLYPSQTGNKIKLSLLIAHLVLLAWIFSSEFSWQFLLIAALPLWFFIAKMGMEIGYHRLWAHRAFTTSPIIEYILLFLGVVSSTGSCITWVAAHRVHHTHADTEQDPQYGNNMPRWRIWLTFWNDNWRAGPKEVKDLLRDPKQRFFHRNYFKMLLAYVAVISAISVYFGSYYPIVTAWAIPVVMNFNLAGLLNANFHSDRPWFNYRNFDTPCRTVNSAVLNIFLAGAGLHNNHHAKQNSYTFNVLSRWYEPDLTGWFIRNFLARTVRLPNGEEVKA